MLEEAMSLSDEMFELQEVLLVQILNMSHILTSSFGQNLLVSNELIEPPPRKRRRTQSIDTESSHDYTSQVDEASEAAVALQHTYAPLNALIQATSD